MRNNFFIFCCCLILSNCSTAQQTAAINAAASPNGQIACAVQGAAGPFLLGLYDAEATTLLALTPGAAVTPVALTAGNLTKAQLDNLCAKAAAQKDATYTGVVSTVAAPPANSAVAAPSVVVP